MAEACWLYMVHSPFFLVLVGVRGWTETGKMEDIE